MITENNDEFKCDQLRSSNLSFVIFCTIMFFFFQYYFGSFLIFIFDQYTVGRFHNDYFLF